jgi:hypothetical protein
LAAAKAAATIPGVVPPGAASLVPWWAVASAWARIAIRWLSLHTGAPALVVAAVLVVVGYRILKKSARFAVEVALVAAGLVAATQAGWIRW